MSHHNSYNQNCCPSVSIEYAQEQADKLHQYLVVLYNTDKFSAADIQPLLSTNAVVDVTSTGPDNNVLSERTDLGQPDTFLLIFQTLAKLKADHPGSTLVSTPHIISVEGCTAYGNTTCLIFNPAGELVVRTILTSTYDIVDRPVGGDIFGNIFVVRAQATMHTL